MFNRRDVQVRPLTEELEELGLDPDKVLGDIERVSGKLIEGGGSPLTSGAQLVEEAPAEASAEAEEPEGEMEFDEDADSDDLDEAVRFRKKGYRMKGGKLVKVTGREKRKEKAARMKKRGAIKAAARMYRKRFKAKIRKRRKARRGKPARKGMIALRTSFSQELANLREELESTGAVTGEPSPYEEAALNAGYLSLLLGEIFEAVGDTEAGGMLRAMSDSAATLSEAIEANDGEVTEETEAKLTSLLDGVGKAMVAHENLGEPSLFEAIDMGIENGLYEDLMTDDDEDEEIVEGDEGDDEALEFDEDESDE